MADTDFQAVQDALAAGGVSAALDQAASMLRREKRYHELFEILKMKTRHDLGLPLLYSDQADALPDDQRDKLEAGLIEACRQVGEALVASGRARDGWMYLRPVGDTRRAADLIGAIEADEDNVEELVDVCLREGVDVGRGFGLVLKYYGTCNAITTFEGEVLRHPKREQIVAAGLLLRHLYDELRANLVSDIGRQEGATPQASSLAELVVDRPWLFQELTYHVDTTHLAAVVRFSRLLESPDQLRLALDLTEYGRRLHKQFQYAGDEPFVELYPSHAWFFQALLGENVAEALAYFEQQARACDPQQVGSAPIEVYVDLLARVGRPAEAIEAALSLMPPGAHSQHIAPTLLDLARRAGDFRRVTEFFREKDDLLSFTTSLTLSR